MASFCEGCPMRGRCKSELVGVKKQPLQGSRFGTGAFITTLAAVVDNRMRVSEPLQIYNSLPADEIIDAVASCEGPEYVEKGIFRKRLVATCPAIGQAACRDPQLYPIAKQVL